MSDNEMLKNAVKALEKKYSGNGALMDARRIPVDKTVHSKMLINDRRKDIDAMFEVNY